MLPASTRGRLVPAHSTDRSILEDRYPERQGGSGVEATRFAPSPTGFVHLGGILVALLAKSVAVSADGIFILRIEDTDQNRFVAGAVEQLFRSLEYFSITPDESTQSGEYGPYQQSARGEIYDVYIADLLSRDLAYPCFCSRQDLEELSERQRQAEVPVGYWGKWAICRSLTEADVLARIDAGQSFVIRFKAPEFTGARIQYTDLIRGVLEIEDNRNDTVIRKTEGLPTYHLAHAVDDHLMHVTTVIRADEWLSSVPLHLQLFRALQFEEPRYAHIAPLLIQDGKSRRKLSKRKDPQANVDYYAEHGYPVEGVLTYLRGLANSGLQDRPWREVLGAELRLEECSRSGQLLDLDKLTQICRDVIADFTTEQVAQRLQEWADVHDKELADNIREDPGALTNVLTIEESAPGHARKDLAKWSDFRPKYGFLLPGLFKLVEDPTDERFAPVAPDMTVQMARLVTANYDHDASNDDWFSQVRKAALGLGFSASLKDYKANPDSFQGPLRDAANVIRVLITGQTRSPDLYETVQILGRAETLRRLTSIKA